MMCVLNSSCGILRIVFSVIFQRSDNRLIGLWFLGVFCSCLVLMSFLCLPFFIFWGRILILKLHLWVLLLIIFSFLVGFSGVHLWYCLVLVLFCCLIFGLFLLFLVVLLELWEHYCCGSLCLSTLVTCASQILLSLGKMLVWICFSIIFAKSSTFSFLLYAIWSLSFNGGISWFSLSLNILHSLCKLSGSVVTFASFSCQMLFLNVLISSFILCG